MDDAVQRVLVYYEKVHSYLESDPETAVSIARKAAEAVCCEVFYTSKKKMTKKMMLNDLIQSLSRDNLLPPHVTVSLGTIQAFGNFGTHYQQEAGKHITEDYIKPCIHALTTVVNWYVEDFCNAKVKSADKPVVVQAKRTELKNEPLNDGSKGFLNRKEVELASGVKMVFLEVPQSSFSMGSNESETGHRGDEYQHEVTLSSFYIMETVVTQVQYKSLLGRNPSFHFGDEQLPVENVTWFEALEFSKKVSVLLNIDCDLPTEAEWELCCRGSSTWIFSLGNELKENDINCDGRPIGLGYVGKTKAVKSVPKNKFGLYDVCGNVQEWCKDSYSRNFYKTCAKENPFCTEGSKKVARGGSYESELKDCRCAARRAFVPNYKSPSIGFRVVVRGDINAR